MSEDLSEIVADRYKPVVRILVVILGAVLYGGYSIIDIYSLWIEQKQAIVDLQEDIKELQAQDVVTRRQLAAMLQNDSDALQAMFDRHDINHDMAQDDMPARRKAHYRSRIKAQRRKEVEVLLKAGKVAQQ